MSATTRALVDAPRRSPVAAFFSATKWQWAVAAEIAVILAIWQLLQGHFQVWSTAFLPPPSAIWEALVSMSNSGTLWSAAGYSGGNALAGYLIAAVLGVFTGILLGRSQLFYDIVGGPFWTLYATPRIAFQPMLVLWMGFGNGPKILIIFLMAFFPIAISTMDGIRGVDRSVLKAARVYGASSAQIFFKVELWAALPLILTGLRMGVARAMIGIVVGEFIGGSDGIGFLLRRRAGELDLASAIGLTVMLVVIALIGMALLNLLRRVVAPWYVEGVARS